MSAPRITLKGRVGFEDHWLFPNLTLRLEPGLWTVLLGASGSGKSTLLRLICNLPIGGRFEGAIAADDGQVLPDRVAYMTQADLLAPWLSLVDNILLGSRLRGETPDRNKALDIISALGLEEHYHKRPHELSGGMKQRASLARVLYEDKPIVLLDEPFSALDFRLRTDMQTLAFNRFQGRTVMLVTHDPVEAARLADIIYVLDERGLEKVDCGLSPPLREGGERTDLEIRLIERLMK